MIDVRRWVVAILTLALIVTGSSVAWFYFNGQLPKKSPVRAKQVNAINYDCAERIDI